MRRVFRTLVFSKDAFAPFASFALAAVLAFGCGGSRPPAGPTPAQTAPSFQQHASAHFTFNYLPIDAASISGTAALVEAEYSRVVGNLGSPSVGRVTVFLHQDFASMQSAVQTAAGTLPSFATGLITNATTIHVISPNVAAMWTYAAGVRAITHEFVHCVSLHVNPALANNPRWLWETVALFENNELVNPRTVPSLVNGQPPPLTRLNGFDNTDVYQVGFTIGEFIVSRWGRDGLIALIRNGGDIPAATGLSPTAFMSDWYAYMRGRYLS